LNKQDALRRLNSLIERATPLFNLPRKNQDFEEWKRDTEVAIDRIFNQEGRHISDFKSINFSVRFAFQHTTENGYQAAYKEGIKSALTLLKSFISEIKEYWSEESETLDSEQDAAANVLLIIQRFHKVARQLRARFSDRTPFEIEDEYDVQDVFHALLKLFFDDVRPEEYTPSYAGAAKGIASKRALTNLEANCPNNDQLAQ
jgi:hypothetical protein